MNRADVVTAAQAQSPPAGWRQWSIPLQAREITLREALDSLASVGARPDEVPLIVRLLENPSYHLPGLSLFPGAVDLNHHDAIHTLLGRGLLKRDEAFVIGFTMGSTRQVGTWQSHLFCWIAANLYPWAYQFRVEDVWVFHGAVRLGGHCGCRRLDTFHFEQYQNATLGELRDHLGIREHLLRSFYMEEIQRFPNSAESERLRQSLDCTPLTDS